MRSTSASLGGITATLRAGDAGVTTDIAVRYVQDTGTRASASSMDERAPQSCARAYMRHAFQLYLWARCALSQHAPSIRLSGHSTFDRGPSADAISITQTQCQDVTVSLSEVPAPAVLRTMVLVLWSICGTAVQSTKTACKDSAVHDKSSSLDNLGRRSGYQRLQTLTHLH